MTRIVVIGDLMTDTVAHAALPLAKGSDTPATVTMHGGGSGANIAAWLAVDGAEVAFVGRRGADIAGRNRDMELMGYGVDARLVMDPERPTGTCVVMVTHKGDHTMMSDPGANAALSPDDLPKDLFTPGSHLHVSGYTLLNEGSRAAALAACARHAGRHDRVGRRRLGRAAGAGRGRAVPADEQRRHAAVRERRPGRRAHRAGGPEQAARVLNAWYPQVVLKLGADGALLFANGREDPVRVPGPPVERIVDGTGAGDAFCAGFLPPWLDKKPPGEALASGCRLAAQALGHGRRAPRALIRALPRAAPPCCPAAARRARAWRPP